MSGPMSFLQARPGGNTVAPHFLQQAARQREEQERKAQQQAASAVLPPAPQLSSFAKPRCDRCALRHT